MHDCQMNIEQIVYVVLTDGPSRGGSLFAIKATQQEAITAALKLCDPSSAIIVPWAIGSEEWDEVYMRVTNGKGLIGYESFASPSK